MLVCNVSMRPRGRTVAAELAEAATAADATTSGFVTLVTLVDDPASASDFVNAYFGEVIIEAASAADAVDAGFVHRIVEAASAADVVDAVAPMVGVVVETAAAASAQDGTVTSAPAYNQWNLSDKSANVTLSNGNLTASPTSTAGGGVRGLYSKTSGKFYFEVTWTNSPGAHDHSAGVTTSASALNNLNTGDRGAVCRTDFGVIWVNGSNSGASVSSFSGFVNGDVACCAVDFDNDRIWFRRNSGQWNGSGTADPATNTGGISIATGIGSNAVFPLVSFILDTAGVQATANFGASAFAYTSPSGFTGWTA